MKAKFVNEAYESNNTRNMLEKLINEQIRMKNTRIKLLAHLEIVYAFQEEGSTLDKKGLTRIWNDFAGVLRNLYSSNDKENKEAYNSELFELAKKKGYRSVWEAAQEKRDEIFNTLMFPTTYDLLDATRKYNRLKKMDLSEAENNFVEKYFPSLELWAELGNKLEEIQKILTPTKAQKQEKELKIIKGTVNPEIKTAIDEIAENFRQVIEENEYKWYMMMLKEFNEKFPNGMNAEDRKVKNNRFLFQNLSRFTILKDKNNLYSPIYILKEKPEELARKLAHDTGVETVASWQFKMYNKLGGFMTELGKKFTTHVDGRLRNNDILFSFEDGSRFWIKNQIVNKISNLGTHFYTYPTTFHDGYLPDGSRIANPNEYTVKNAFNNFKK